MSRADNLRRALAQEAARIMAEHGVQDFLLAKRKAAERLGVTDVSAVLPKNREIEVALAEYQRLFGGESHAETLSAAWVISASGLTTRRWAKKEAKATRMRPDRTSMRSTGTRSLSTSSSSGDPERPCTAKPRGRASGEPRRASPGRAGPSGSNQA